jgi:hypothetical protein
MNKRIEPLSLKSYNMMDMSCPIFIPSGTMKYRDFNLFALIIVCNHGIMTNVQNKVNQIFIQEYT